MKNRILNIYLVIGLVILFTLWMYLVGYPWLDPYDAKIVIKNSNIYDKPIYLTFNWQTDDQIQVGPLNTLKIEVRGLPYNENSTKPNIELFFDEKYLNYWSENKKDENEILSVVPFKLEPDWDNNVFRSQNVKFRFIVPADIFLNYCDYNLNTPCHIIPNILHPAPYDLEERIKTNRVIISATLTAAALTGLVLWSRFRHSN